MEGPEPRKGRKVAPGVEQRGTLRPACFGLPGLAGRAGERRHNLRRSERPAPPAGPHPGEPLPRRPDPERARSWRRLPPRPAGEGDHAPGRRTLGGDQGSHQRGGQKESSAHQTSDADISPPAAGKVGASSEEPQRDGGHEHGQSQAGERPGKPCRGASVPSGASSISLVCSFRHNQYSTRRSAARVRELAFTLLTPDRKEAHA
jgi:hypothetical protein